jgi:hypothetical protein
MSWFLTAAEIVCRSVGCAARLWITLLINDYLMTETDLAELGFLNFIGFLDGSYA